MCLRPKIAYAVDMIRKNVTTHGFSSTAEIDSWIGKIPSAIEKYIDSDDQSAIANIYVRHYAHHADGEKFAVETTLRARKIFIHAEAENKNLQSAIESVRDEIVKELSSKRKKRKYSIRKGGQMVKEFVRGM